MRDFYLPLLSCLASNLRYRNPLQLQAVKLKRHTVLGAFVLFLGATGTLLGQALPARIKLASLQAGVGFSFANPDYGPKDISGLTLYADYDLLHNIGFEGDVHLITLNSPTDIGENTYLIGPRAYYRKKRFKLYGKVLGGLGQFSYKTPYYVIPYSTYNAALAFGGGLDITVTRRINIRAFDYEYQMWPNYRNDGLTPVVYTFGAAYHF